MRSSERGSIIVLVAALSIVLVAVVGLAVDGGEITAQYRASQNAADGSALAAAIQITNGVSETRASAIASIVVQQNQVPAADLVLNYYDSSGTVTSIAADVASVTAVITHSFPTIFLPIMGINNATVSATASAKVTSGSSCAVCVMSPSASGALNLPGGGNLSVTGGNVQVNSNSSSALQVSSSATLSASGGAIDVAGGDSGSVSSNISPAPTLGAPAVSDPFASVPVPSVSGSQTCCAATLNPGVYSSISISSAAEVNMNPGIYVVTGSLSISGSGSLIGHQVMIYLACSSYPAPCTSGGQAGAGLTIKGNSNVDLSAPSYGDYQGLLIFSDRNNTSGLALGGNGTTRFAGSVYALSGLTDLSGNGGGSFSNAQVVSNQVEVTGTGTLGISFSQSGNYRSPNNLDLSQ